MNDAAAAWTDAPAVPHMALQRVRVRCEGVTPFLFDAVDEDRVLDIARGARTPKPSKRLLGSAPALRAWYTEHVAQHAIVRRDGQPGIPPDYLLASMIAAGNHLKFDGERLTTRDASMVPSLVQIAEDFLPFPNDDWTVDLRLVRRKRKRKLQTAARAKFPRWGFTATLLFDPDIVHPDLLRQLAQIAGFRIGIGAFHRDPRRPYAGKVAVFGRFRITEWTPGEP